MWSDASSLPNAGGFGKQKDQHLEVCWYLFLGGCYAWWDTLVCLSSKCLLFIFWTKMTQLCPEPRTVNGHGTQILQQWTWQALLGVKQFTERVSVTSSNQSPINSKVKNLHHLSPIFSCPWVGSGGFCPISARTETEVRFDGPLCWKNSVADLEECKTYTSYTGTQLWQCLNSTLVEMVRWNDFLSGHRVLLHFNFRGRWCSWWLLDLTSVEVEHVHSQWFRPRRWPWPQHPRWQAFRTGRKSEIREEREREGERTYQHRSNWYQDKTTADGQTPASLGILEIIYNSMFCNCDVIDI